MNNKLNESRESLLNWLNCTLGFQVRQITKSLWEVCSGGDVTIIKVHAFKNGDRATYIIKSINGVNFN